MITFENAREIVARRCLEGLPASYAVRDHGWETPDEFIVGVYTETMADMMFPGPRPFRVRKSDGEPMGMVSRSLPGRIPPELVNASHVGVLNPSPIVLA